MLGGERELVAQDRLELPQRRRLELPHALAREAELPADRLERDRRVVQAEPQLDDLPLALGKARKRLAHGLAAQALDRRLLGILRLAVGDQVAELGAVVLADPLVQRDGR